MGSLGAILLSKCGYCCCLGLLEKKKKLVLEGGVELPVLHENGHTDVWSTMVKNKKKIKKITKGRGGSECVFRRFQSNSSSVVVSVEGLLKTFKMCSALVFRALQWSGFGSNTPGPSPCVAPLLCADRLSHLL